MNPIPCSPADRAALAKACGVLDAYLYQIFTRRKTASAELCVDIEQHSAGRFTRQLLRPTDWHRIWPELAANDQAREVANG